MVQETNQERKARKARAIADDARAPQGERDAARKVADTLDEQIRKERIKERAKARADAKSEPSEPSKGATLSVADIAKALGVDPKLARAKLRRLAAKGTSLPGFAPSDGRWPRVVVDSDTHKWLVAILTPDVE